MTPTQSSGRFIPLAAGFVAMLLQVAAITASVDNPLGTAPFAGSFSDGALTAEFSSSGGGYVGTITLGGKQFPVRDGAGRSIVGDVHRFRSGL